jgi:hypothetical protein
VFPAVAALASVVVVSATQAPGTLSSAARPSQPSQSDSSYAASVSAVLSNTFATEEQTSCYRPEVPAPFNLGPAEGYSGQTACPGATTGENTGAASPYGSQVGSNPGYAAGGAVIVKDHSESDIRVDPTNPNHLIGSSKWIVSAEGYNHLLGFYESFNGGQTWPLQGHIPGYEGWTDNTDPVGAFDTHGNYYELILPYQFYYNADGSHNFQTDPNKEPNPTVPAEAITVAVRPHGSSTATAWRCGSTACGSDHNFDVVASYAPKGHEPDKQWITIDTNPNSPFKDTIYAMWVDFTGCCTAHPYVSTAHANADGTHTAWSSPVPLPTGGSSPQGATYLLPHVTPDGAVWTTLTNSAPKQGYSTATIVLDGSTDGGRSWNYVSTVADQLTAPPLTYANTTFRDGIEDSFATGTLPVNGRYPLYVPYEDYSAGVVNILLTASYDDGKTWSAPTRVNDNTSPVDEFQPNATTGPDGTVSIAFYDRRIACPSDGPSGPSGVHLDTANPKWGSSPPYNATNYCVNASIQFYSATLAPKGHNIRLTQITWDPQLNAPHTSSPGGSTTFIGDYFGNAIAPDPHGTGYLDYTTSVSTYDTGGNAANRQQQLVAVVRVP